MMKKILYLFIFLTFVLSLSITAYAYDEYDPYICFDANGGTGSMETVYMNGNFPLPECGFTPPEGYRFKHWQVEGHSPKYPGDTVYVDNRTVAKAIWEKIPAKVVFENGDGTIEEVEIFGDYTLPECTFNAPDGQQFKCWYVKGEEKQPGESIYVDDILTVTAGWEDIPKPTFTVTFDAGEGKGKMDSVEEISGEYILPENDFKPPRDMQFKAWDVDGTEYQPGDTIEVTEDITVKAIWEEIVSEEAAEDDQDHVQPVNVLLIVAIVAVVAAAASVVVLIIVLKKK